jgi:type I restriction enzyme S subunit
MNNWQNGILSDVAEIDMGQSPSGEYCSTNNIGLPLLNGPTEFTINSPIPVQFTSDPKRLSRVGDLLFCVRGSTTGKMNWSDQVYAIGRGIAAIRHKKSQNLNRFIRAIIEYNLEELLAGATGSTFPNVSGQDLKSIQIDIPTPQEQESIAEVLSSLDDKIDLLHRQNKTLEELAETLFRQWFVEEAEAYTTLSSYAKVVAGYAFKSSDFKEEGNNRVIKITNIDFESVDVNKTQFINLEINSKLNKYVIPAGAFVIAMTGAEIGKIGIVPKASKTLLLNQRVGLLVDNVPGGSIIGYLFLRSIEGQDFIINEASGSAQPNISTTGIESMKVPQLDNEKLKKLITLLNPLFSKKLENLNQINTLENLRDTLLPKLMCGAVRVIN